MTIHIITTNEFDRNLLIDIQNIISSSDGEVIVKTQLVEEISFDLTGTMIPHSFFLLPVSYRLSSCIKQNEFVIVLSQVPKGSFSWESNIIDNNFYIISDENEISKNQVDEKYFFVFEIIYGILNRFYTDDRIKNEFDHVNRCLYQESDSTITRYKKIYPLICEECWTKLISINKGQELAFIHFMNILERIHNNFIYKPKAKNISIHPVRLNTKNFLIEILSDQKIKIQLSGTLKTLYVFFLLHPEGVQRSNLLKYKNEITRIYEQIMPNRDAEIKEGIINNLLKSSGGSFDTTVGRIGKYFESTLSTFISNYYKIQNTDGVYRINLPEEKIIIVNNRI